MAKVEGLDKFRDQRLKEIISSAIYGNYDVIPEMLRELANGELDPENFKIALFSNTKLKIIEKIAEEMDIENPGSKEAWEEVTKKYSLEKIQELTDQLAEGEIKKAKHLK